MATIDKHENGNPSWFDLMTPDPDKARAFYTGLFGWTYDISGPEMGHYAMAKIGDRNAAGVGGMPPNAPYPTAWSVYFQTADSDATAKAIQDAGGSVMMGPMEIPGAGRMMVAADPTGAVFGTWEPRGHIGAGVHEQHGSMAWSECHTSDGAKAKDFYARVFKLEPVKVEGMTYWIMQRGPAQLCGVDAHTALPPGVPPHWLAYFAVDDTDAAVKKTQASGGKVMMPAFDTPHGRMAVLADPFGAVFAVIKPPR